MPEGRGSPGVALPVPRCCEQLDVLDVEEALDGLESERGDEQQRDDHRNG
jgi:hypothetical protein